MSQVQGYTNRTFKALGRILLHKYPAIAEELIPFCQAEGETDMDLLPGYFKRFCEIKQINPLEHIGELRSDREKMNNRMLFVACMLHIYNQHIFHTNGSTPFFRRGFVKHLSECQSISPTNISLMIRKVMVHERVYDDFKKEIQSIVNQLKQTVN